MSNNSFAALIEALEVSRKPSDDAGLTLRELAQRVGRCEDWVRKRLYEANEAGLLICGKRTISGIDGRRAHSPVYSFKKARKK